MLNGLVKRVHTWRLADSRWQQAGPSGPMAGPLLAERAGEKKSMASWPPTRIQPKAIRKIGKCFPFFQIFFKIHNRLN
jgi:hypothetical protein